MGSYLDLPQPATNSFAFGDLRARVPLSSFTGNISTQRLAISEPNSTDDFSALVRINDAAITGDDAPVTFPSGTRRWLVLDVHRNTNAAASPVYNVLTNNTNWAVLQFNENARKVRIVQNLPGTARSYSGSFVVGTNYACTTLHRSWTNTVTPLTASNGTATVADTIPAFGHMIAVNSNQDGDHTNSHRTSADVYGAPAYMNELMGYACGTNTPVTMHTSPESLTFPRLCGDVTYRVEATSNLTSWKVLAENPGNLGENVTVLDVLGPEDNPAQRFMRLNVSVPPP